MYLFLIYFVIKIIKFKNSTVKLYNLCTNLEIKFYAKHFDRGDIS